MPVRNRTTLLVVHVTATPPGADIGVKEVRAMHKAKGWSDIGYHYVIRRNGNVETGRPENQIGAHVAGFNSTSMGISMIGGVSEAGRPEDNMTAPQYAALETLLRELSLRYPMAKVCGHRDLSPDQDGDGEIEQGEWIKACPCFNAIPWARARGLPPAAILGPWSHDADAPRSEDKPPPAGPDARDAYLQRLLARTGVTFGPIDGLVGKRTKDAIGVFQATYGLPVTKTFDAATAARLRAMFELKQAA